MMSRLAHRHVVGNPVLLEAPVVHMKVFITSNPNPEPKRAPGPSINASRWAIWGNLFTPLVVQGNLFMTSLGWLSKVTPGSFWQAPPGETGRCTLTFQLVSGTSFRAQFLKEGLEFRF